MKETEGEGTVEGKREVGKRESKCGRQSFHVCTNQGDWLDSASSTSIGGCRSFTGTEGMVEQSRLEPRTCCALVLSAANPLLLYSGGGQQVLAPQLSPGWFCVPGADHSATATVAGLPSKSSLSAACPSTAGCSETPASSAASSSAGLS